MVYCRICNKKYESITNSHLRKHNTSIREYIEEYNLEPLDWMSEKYLQNSKKMVEATRKLSESNNHWTQSPSGRLKNSALREQEYKKLKMKEKRSL